MGVKHVSMSFCRFNPLTHITNQYLNQLNLEANIDILTRDIYGYTNEIEAIATSKKMFSFYYNLSTPLRSKHQYLLYFFHLYQKFPNSIRYLRILYKQNGLDFYDSFLKYNSDSCSEGIERISYEVRENPLDMVVNMLIPLQDTCIVQLKGLLEFDLDLQTVSQSQNDISIRKIYNFLYFNNSLKLLQILFYFD